MDLDEWEVIGDDGFLEIHDDGGKQIYTRKYVRDPLSNRTFFDINYFGCPSSPKSQKFVESTTATEVPRLRKQLVPIQFQENIHKAPGGDHEVVKEMILFEEVPIRKISLAPSIILDQESPVSQVSFKKMIKENEFQVDMKLMDSSSSPRGIMPQIDEVGRFQFEEKADDGDDQNMETLMEGRNDGGNEVVKIGKKWGLNGIGAICSFGVAAAATICIIILGNGHKHNHHHHKLRFQIYTDDKGIKEVMQLQQASRLNEAMSSTRGIPLARAHITFGGYYDAL